MMLKKVFLLLVLIGAITGNLFSQQSDSARLASVIPELFKRLKISGLLQTQYQSFQTAPGGITDRISIRRARLKFTYAAGFTQFVMQFHTTEKNVGPDELYLMLTDPWTKTLSLSSGVFNRPFGNEIPYSASALESDERARIIRTLFPLEKDLGAMLSFHPKTTSPFSLLYIDAGIFNGTGPANEDFDNRKNFIGHIYTKNGRLGDLVSFGGGLSWYKGGFSNQRTRHYEWENGFVPVMNDSLALSEQDLKGVDAQMSFNWSFGLTRMRFEYINGAQAGTVESTTTPSKAPANKSGQPLPSYLRNCSGGYLIFIQELLKGKLQLVFKYDWYDPNTEVSGRNIGLGNGTGVADILYHNYGMGVNYKIDKNIRATACYNFVKNESTSLDGYNSDVQDNNFVLRLQYAF